MAAYASINKFYCVAMKFAALARNPGGSPRHQPEQAAT
jgi:hypothetical protein